MPRFAVRVRAIQCLTKEIELEASSEADARAQALYEADDPNFDWDVGDPEDIQHEGTDKL